jgi:hypothetical protein
VARDEAHHLAAAKTADPDNADANAHGGVLRLEWPYPISLNVVGYTLSWVGWHRVWNGSVRGRCWMQFR